MNGNLRGHRSQENGGQMAIPGLEREDWLQDMKK